MTPITTRATNAAQIQELLDKWADAVRAKDSKALMSNFSPDVLVFDLINPLQYVGLESLQERAENWLGSFEGPLGYQTDQVSITAGDDVAFCHSLNRVNGTKKDGMKIDMYWRATLCFRKIHGRWMVTHEHSSVPFDMNSGKASLGLKP